MANELVQALKHVRRGTLRNPLPNLILRQAGILQTLVQEQLSDVSTMPIMIIMLLLILMVLLVNRSSLGQHVLPGTAGLHNDAPFRVIYTPK